MKATSNSLRPHHHKSASRSSARTTVEEQLGEQQQHDEEKPVSADEANGSQQPSGEATNDEHPKKPLFHDTLDF